MARKQCGRCLKDEGGKRRSKAVVLQSLCVAISVKIAMLKERTPGKHSPPKKRLIARDDPSCSYVPSRFWIVLNIGGFDF